MVTPSQTQPDAADISFSNVADRLGSERNGGNIAPFIGVTGRALLSGSTISISSS